MSRAIELSVGIHRTDLKVTKVLSPVWKRGHAKPSPEAGINEAEMKTMVLHEVEEQAVEALRVLIRQLYTKVEHHAQSLGAVVRYDPEQLPWGDKDQTEGEQNET